MKKLVCEMCGSNNIVKQDGLYVCQNCDTKYSPEEAKKIMFDEPVEVIGSVEITKNLESSKRMGDEAFDRFDYKEAFTYYTQVVESDPSDYLRKFKRLIAAAASVSLNQSGKVDEPLSELSKFCKAVEADTTLSDTEKSEKIVWAFSTMDTLIVGIYNLALKIFIGDGRVIESSYTQFLSYTDTTLLRQVLLIGDANEYIEKYADLQPIWNKICDNALTELLNKSKKYTDSVLAQVHFLSDEGAKGCYDFAKIFAERKQKFEPDYKLPSQLVPPSEGGQGTERGGGCYVATAVYGSYDCPQVWTLRRYRDYTLASSWYGRLFIKTYYAISPTLVRWFGNTAWFKRIWKQRLDKMVAGLKANGFEDTPYKDRHYPNMSKGAAE